MRVKGIWNIKLPVRLGAVDSFKHTKLTNVEFNIEDMTCRLIKSKEGDYYDAIQAELYSEYDDKYLPAHLSANFEYLSTFEEKIDKYVSSRIQIFVDGITYAKKYVPFRISDGQSFVTDYTFTIEPNILNGSGVEEKIVTLNFDDNAMEKAVHFANREKDYLDNAWFILNDIEYYIDLGKYDVAIITMGTLLEYLVAYKLRHFLDSSGYFLRLVDKAELERIKTERKKESGNAYATFGDKYYRFGLGLLNHKMDEQLIIDLDLVYKTRNELVHGGVLSDTKAVKVLKIEEHEHHLMLNHFRNVCVDVYNYFSDDKHILIFKELIEEVYNVVIELKDMGKFENSVLNDFPKGCCSHMSEILCRILYDRGYFGKYVCGIKDGATHAWVECKGIIIDITCGQLEGIDLLYEVKAIDESGIHLGYEASYFDKRDFDGQFTVTVDESTIYDDYILIQDGIRRSLIK